MRRCAIHSVKGLSISTIVALCGGVLSALAPGAHAQVGTAFTYQGQLTSAGQPASGAHDLRFRLFDSVGGTTQIGPTLCSDNVVLLADGRFAVELDFGSVYSGEGRFLEIEVRPDTGVSCASAAGFLVLGPRQSLTAAPYAVRAESAGSATTADSASTALALNGQPASFYQNAANLTSGSLPGARLAGTYPGTISFTGPITLSNPTNTIAGSGAGLINLNADNIASGVLTPTNGGTGSDTSGTTDGEVLKFFSGRWVGAADNDTTYTAGSGLALDGTRFSIPPQGIEFGMLASNSVDTFAIAPNAIIGSDISDNSIGTSKILNNAITAIKIATGAVGAEEIGDGSVGNADMQGNSIASVNIIDGTIASADIAGNAINTFLILDSTVSSADIAPDTILAADIAAGAIGASEIALGAVGASELGANAVGNAALANDALSLSKVSAGAMISSGGRIGINTSPGTNELTVNGRIETTTGMTTQGTITAAEFAFLNPFPRVYTVGPLDFTVRDNALELGGATGGDYTGELVLFNDSGISDSAGIAPVHLPDGAEVVSFEILVEDDAASDNVTALLLRRTIRAGTAGTMASIASSGQVPGVNRSFIDTTISGAVIDNANNTYAVHISIDGTLAILRFKGAVIRYRITRPLP